jgi:hypothetical protein
MKIARWVDLGAPIDLSGIIRTGGDPAVVGFLEDDLRPTLSLVPSTGRAAAAGRLSRFVIGAYDLDSGIDPSTLSLTLDKPVGSSPAGTNLVAGQPIADGATLSVSLPATLDLTATSVTVTVQIKDRAGHLTRIVRSYGRVSAGNPCLFPSISPASQSFGASGGPGTFNITTGSGCAWTAATNASWIVLTSTATGSGAGTISFTVQQNSSTSSRSETIGVAGLTFTVNQQGAEPPPPPPPQCNFSIAPTKAVIGAAGGPGSITVTGPQGCNWQATSKASWITITAGASGSGNGTVSYSVARNSSSSSRKGKLKIAGLTLTIKQRRSD